MTVKKIISRVKPEKIAVLHVCSQEERITELVTMMKRILTDWYGNGQEGLIKTIPKMQGAVETLVITVAANTQVIADLVKWQSGLQGIEGYKKEEALSSRQKTAIIVTAILGSCAIITSIILKLL
jgi:hypothetical protein